MDKNSPSIRVFSSVLLQLDAYGASGEYSYADNTIYRYRSILQELCTHNPFDQRLVPV